MKKPEQDTTMTLIRGSPTGHRKTARIKKTPADKVSKGALQEREREREQVPCQNRNIATYLAAYKTSR
ncbi:hypothetical protein MBAV_005080 [Candidatus Magnetobacterium bavaricum]|uniref:Uncharacterized protein n=1 Tax=Candidatus Magnetobacterium bavaricum TaxID=29290 RepID=A0A0F3GLC8_9BACT|nr:hypothetical protein MBAV_005080 [Candidatus Magnetobacterium bavaricum]